MTDGSSEKVTDRTKKLVEQICSLQSEKATLTAQLMTLQANLDAHKGRKDKEVKELKVTNEKVLKEKGELEEKIFKMQATKVIYIIIVVYNKMYHYYYFYSELSVTTGISRKEFVNNYYITPVF